MAESKRGIRKTANGEVVSVAGDKTIVVRISYKIKHPLYGKYVRRHTKLKAHNPENEAGLGDFVSVIETRPMSKTKRWRLVEILKKAKSLAMGPSLDKDVPAEEANKKTVDEVVNADAPSVQESDET